MVLVYAGRFASRLLPQDDAPVRRVLTRAVPTLSAATMTLVGAVVTLQGLSSLGGVTAFLP